MEHPAVEAGVVGKPDPVAGEVVRAFVSLHARYTPSENLRRELLGRARKPLGAAVAPKEIVFDQHLPHTTIGKVMRRLLEAREAEAQARARRPRPARSVGCWGAESWLTDHPFPRTPG
jgi:acetyl-CoA synthetase